MAHKAGRTTESWATWDRFIRAGKIEPGALGPELEASWHRCKAAGVDPLAGRSTLVLGSAAFAALAERKQDLIRVAKPFMENLYSLVAGSSFVVLLFDEQGYLLEAVGDQDRILASQDLNLNKGALWAEGEVGTNGAGTPLVLGRPFQVSGAEHYCQKHHRWTCSGAPIFDPRGKTIGLLDMTGPVDETHIHTLGLVMAAVQAIQHELKLGQKNQELTLLNNRLSSILFTVTDGVLVLDVDGVLSQINPVAERLLGVSNPQAAGKRMTDLVQDLGPIRELLEWGQEFLDREMELKSSRGAIQCIVSGKPILDEGGLLKGAVLFVNPINKIKRLINRFSGAQATFRFEDILGQGESLQRAVQQGQLASANESNVLLTGESGTGKEMFAHAIHNQSERRKGPFVAVNCGAIPRELIASELFGYQDGAFTGAARGGRPGKFELASGGTLFLDEIGDMPLEQQIALLRVLQDRTITRLGGDRSFVVDVRIICATHKDLREEIRKGTFRQDLYYRLNVSMIKLPPLREHPEDIPELLEAFMYKFAARKGVSNLRIDPRVIGILQGYAWPGNIREFQNVVERMIHSVQGTELSLNDIPDEILRVPDPPLPMAASQSPGHTRSAGPASLREQLLAEERETIQASLRTWKGNMSKAAQELGMARNTLYRKVQKLGI
ncbi:MAG: sigma-54-dependent Fis family transcriptional regulator [Geothrix sp.]|uniref:sigma-54-dependent Fis family transcriptional regulator n=1 Tax=Geothrix sp. TaxID=1962974 RepID=UPI001829DA59|nr:sigma-54-dependent Fis family transcriptional regulator [Geothrix sp.]NWJ40290.1 sigma-54-dependent Fis family transcriptional regulator [Geothrix sp.]WIL21705.1 MAG: sigma-54-dependent Fis family transcriptional regulator [Geothrix sp.]